MGKNTLMRWTWLVLLGGAMATTAHGCGDEVATFDGTGGTTATGGSGGSDGGEGGVGGSAGSGGSVPLACEAPASVPDPWEVTFRPYQLGTGTPVDGALIEVKASDGTVLASTTTNGSGEGSLSIATGGEPIDGYFTASKTGYLTTRFRIQGGLGWFPGWHTMMATEAFADNWVSGHWSSETREPGTAVVLSLAFDCNKGWEAWGLAGAIMDFDPAGLDVVYMRPDGTADPVLTTTSRRGQATTANVPAGESTLTVSLDGVDTVYSRPMEADTWEVVLLYPKAGPPECRPNPGSGFQPVWKPSNGLAQGLCTDQQATAATTACFGPSATQAACDAWKADGGNAACLGCALAQYDDANWNAVVHYEHLNIHDRAYAQCISAFEGDLTDQSCGATVHTAWQCSLYACQDGCPIETESAALDIGRFNDCFRAAREGDCSSYWTPAEACLTALLGNGDPIDQCTWDSDNESFAVLAERYIRLICGDGTA
ncbi:MAG: carboxypeptidase regulatory-like domain-containing protein [Deltaproteobacteria bacterium]|nr:carboxypeptidase regulatory-like domain-containing protein [Deltaproteobacteria bacterium]